MNTSLIETLRRGTNDAWRLGLTDAQLAQFARYADLLVEWNATRMNLTRITEPHEIAVKHFLDSLTLVRLGLVPSRASIIDVGAGAGLPGLVLKIARPDLSVTLLDSTAKKLTFCRAVADDLGLEGVVTLHARAEDAGRQAEQAGAYDIAVARALAPLVKLLPWCAPFVRPGGAVVALKGASVAEELGPARPVARRLGLTLQAPAEIALPEADEPTVRQIVVARRLGEKSGP